MQHSKVRYVTFCQQLLATAAVLATAVAAAGVVSLDIVNVPEQPGTADPRTAVRIGDAYVESKPVTPQVRNVALKQSAKPVRARRVSSRLVAAVSSAQRVHGMTTVGVTWAAGQRVAEDVLRFQVRTAATLGKWDDWTDLEYHPEHAGDGGRPGTEPLVVGRATQAQLRVLSPDGRMPRDLRFAVITPGHGHVERATGQGEAATKASSITLAAKTTGPTQPQVLTRAQWGADERMRDGSPRYGTIQAAFVHHTVNANDYTREQVPALLRSIYAYHTKSRGWSDIGYNFLVDRFGQIWEGRYGGIDKAVIGAHTLGYNEVVFAMSAIGNFEEAEPSPEMINAYARLFAWKLSMYGIRADSKRLWVKNRYLNAVNGHRDTGQTACPGKFLYARIDEIATKAAAIQDGAGPIDPTPTPTPTPTPSTPPFTPVPENRLPVSSNVLGSAFPDLLLREKATDKVYVQPTGGQLGFRVRKTSDSGAWASGETISAAGDLTGDGRGDLIAHKASTGVTKVIPGDGDGGFKPALSKTKRFAGYSWLLGVGDFNGDGRDDLIGLSAKRSRLMLLPRTGNDSFGRAVRLVSTWSYAKTYAAGNFVGDSHPDLLARTSGGQLYAFPGTGSGLGKPVAVNRSLQGIDQVVGGGDFTGDKLGDLLIREKATKKFWVLPGTGAGGLAAALGPFTGMSGMVTVTAADLVKGGGVEFVGRASRGRVRVVETNAGQNLSPRIDTGIVMGKAGQIFNAGDWNGDGLTDIISRPTGASKLVIRLGRTRTTWADYQTLARGFADVTRLAAVGDVTGDGRPDLAGQAGNGKMMVWPGDGKAGLKSPVVAPKQVRTFNQLGKGLWDPTRAPATVIGSGDGSFVPMIGTASPFPAGSYDLVLGPGDLDGDKVADLAARDRDGRLWLLPGGTDGSVGERRLIGTGFAAYDLIG